MAAMTDLKPQTVIHAELRESGRGRELVVEYADHHLFSVEVNRTATGGWDLDGAADNIHRRRMQWGINR
jgi:hypothetical protein